MGMGYRARDPLDAPDVPQDAEVSPLIHDQGRTIAAYAQAGHKSSNPLTHWFPAIMTHHPLPYSSFCPTCEHSNTADWIEERGRYECDACQREHRCERNVCEAEQAE